MTKLKIFLFAFLSVFFNSLCGQSKIVIEQIQSPSNSTFRAIKTINDSTVWVSGSRGVVMRTSDYGKNWDVFTPDTLKRIDFRSLYAWGKDTAIVFTAGSPAICYKTTNGGKSWDKTFYLEHKDVFVNSMDFKNNKEGIVWGDPMDGKFFMLKTNDAGETWAKFDAPIALNGDGGFAASNSCVAYLPSGKIAFVMGVTRSAFYWTNSDSNIDWNVSNTGLVQGGDSNADGIYCVRMFDDNKGIVAGGNYTNVNDNSQVLAVTNDGGKTWQSPNSLPHGFVSAIGALNAQNGELIAVGSHGSSISKDNGLNWLKNGDDGYHALSESPSGNYIYFCGERGKLGIIIL